MRRFAIGLAALLLAGAPLHAQPSPHGERPPEARRTAEPRGPEGRKLPADSVTEHSVTLPDGRVLAFTARAGSLPLVDEEIGRAHV